MISNCSFHCTALLTVLKKGNNETGSYTNIMTVSYVKVTPKCILDKTCAVVSISAFLSMKTKGMVFCHQNCSDLM